MTTNEQMLEAMRKVERKGISLQKSKTYLKQSGVLDNKGNITPKYQGVLKVKTQA